ncbi:uncharacterized protein B0I36DRAFT_348906 [Microdochium trichocladiopsis]|uniref:Uncharacterized protein n=1 Tax=Microdochium trichocladiopsis TaxID=1682393 RepID=A0A9P8Y3Y1_9PEZI|nr:uncharacterized protein B0I36DRAFT_348906 [Microdochium trichocladiopsis]KAH7030712.1 hypothetical protein B0I36DRAFT_348906 [Microdochium trichocladiopsis]
MSVSADTWNPPYLPALGMSDDHWSYVVRPPPRRPSSVLGAFKEQITASSKIKDANLEMLLPHHAPLADRITTTGRSGEADTYAAADHRTKVSAVHVRLLVIAAVRPDFFALLLMTYSPQSQMSPEAHHPRPLVQTVVGPAAQVIGSAQPCGS